MRNFLLYLNTYKSPLIKILIIILILNYIIFYLDIDFDAVINNIAAFSFQFIIFIVLALLIVEFSQIPIINSLVAPYNIKMKPLLVYKINLISVFYHIFMPLGKLTGGAIRWHRLSKVANNKKALFNSIILQNLLDLLLYSIFALIIFIFNNPMQKNFHNISYIISSFFISITFIPTFAILNPNIMNFILNRIIFPLSNKLLPLTIAYKVTAFMNSILVYNHQYKNIFKALLSTLIYRFGYFIVFYLLALNINIYISPLELVSLFIASNLLSFIPLPLNGLGTREIIFISLAAFYNINQVQALTFSLSIFSFGIIIAALGGVLELLQQTAFRNYK